MNALRAAAPPRAASLALVGDVIDLKLPVVGSFTMPSQSSRIQSVER